MSELIWLTDRQMKRIEPFTRRYLTGLRGLMTGGFSVASSL